MSPKTTRREFLVGFAGAITGLCIGAGLVTACSPREVAVTDLVAVSVVEQQEGLPDYGALKQRMKADWKRIRKAVRKRRALDPAVVRSFRADAQVMTSFSGKGDPHYEAFLEEVDRLAAAAEAGDYDRLAEAAAAVRDVEKACHRRYR